MSWHGIGLRVTPDELLGLLAKLGPLAREQGIESIELEDAPPGPFLKLVKFYRVPQMVAVPMGEKKSTEPDKPRQTFGGRDPADIRHAIPNWGQE